jgi:hypothetical protein
MGFDLLLRERSTLMRVAEYTPDNMAAARFIARMVRPCFLMFVLAGSLLLFTFITPVHSTSASSSWLSLNLVRSLMQ